MAKLTLTDGTIFEGTTEELIALTEQFSGKVADPVADSITHNGVEYTLVDRKAREGDVVVFTETDSPTLKNGKYYEVSDGGPEGVAVDASSDDFYNVYSDMFNRTVETVLVYEPKADPLKVGDYAVVSGSSIFGVDLDGKVGTYRGPSENIPSLYARVEVLNEKEYLVKRELVRKATDAEVAEAKASAGRNAVFTQAGRKPNEYRKGDIVRVNDPLCTSHLNIGQITEVVTPTGSTNPQVRSNNGSTRYAIVEPVTFVENRLDLRK